VERRRKALRPPGNAQALAPAGALPYEGEKAVVRTDKAAPVGLHDDRIAPAPDPGIDDREKNRAAWILIRERGEEMRGRLDAEVGRVVQGIDDRHAGRARREDGFDLAYVEVAGTEIGKKDEKRDAQAALASFFASFFLAGFSSVCGLSSARSNRVTSASGALSPLRKPFLRMRR